jgi:uncharacterized membrane protein YfcA
MTILPSLAFAAGAGLLGGTMNALAGGGTFVTMPALIALRLPSPIANATSNVALLPGAGTSAWAYRDELAPVGGLPMWVISAITFAGGLVGSVLLVLTPSHAFDLLIPWLLLFAFAVMLTGKRASEWLRARVTIGTGTLAAAQGLLGIYGGYFGGGVGLITTAVYGLLAGTHPRALFAMRTLMLFVANLAATLVFIAVKLVAWQSCAPMLVGGIAGGWAGARIGKRLSHRIVRVWTLLITGAITIAFFYRAYG